MNFETFEPVYEAILDDFGFDRAADERARDVAAEFATPFPLDRFGEWTGRTVAVAGAAPCLEAEVELARDADVVVAASTAADVLAAANVDVDCMVTDLDKNPETAWRLTTREVPVVAHAHGDNVSAIREWLPQFEADWTLVTTQAAPRGPVRHVGGFTDGDRAAVLADHLGAGELLFPGWAFDDPNLERMKARKLRWAARLLRWLERRREEQFAVLDGWRHRIDGGSTVAEGRWSTD